MRCCEHEWALVCICISNNVISTMTYENVADVSRSTLVSVRRVVPSSEVTTETWEVGVPGSSSMVTVSSITSWGSCIMASDVWLLGLCSCGTKQRVVVQGQRSLLWDKLGVQGNLFTAFNNRWGNILILLILSTHKRAYSKGMTRAGTQCKDLSDSVYWM